MKKSKQDTSTHNHWLASGLGLGIVLLLSGCSVLQGPIKPKASHSNSRMISVGEEFWTISYQTQGNIASDDDIVPGEILIQNRDQVVQTIKHSLSSRAAAGEDGAWLLVEDVNDDGAADFLLTHAPTSAGANPVKSLYLFDQQSQTFQLQKEISKLGDIDKLSGCVVVTAAEAEGPEPRTYCFSTEKNGWMEIRRSTADAGPRCNPNLKNLAECRALRNQRDGEMLRFVRSYIDIKSKSMVKENRKSATTGFARNLRVGHAQWLRYRDARCASYVIEYNFPASSRAFEMESCKLDLSSLQSRHYSSMLTSLKN